MTCNKAKHEIGESVHAGNWPEGSLAAHLKACGECGDEWESRQDLVRHLGAMRKLAAVRQSPLDRRAQLMRDFASRQPRRPAPAERWKWVFAAAAMLVLMAGVGSRAWDLLTSGHAPVVAMDTAADNDGQEGFIAVPYAPALAAGEVLRVVRTELYPASLVSLGLDMDPALTGRMPADLLVGEDGYPRAVRISADSESNF